MKTQLINIIFIFYFSILTSFAQARVITVDRCTIPFDFTIGSICVLGTLSLWIIVPLFIALVFGGFQVIVQLIKNMFR